MKIFRVSDRYKNTTIYLAIWSLSTSAVKIGKTSLFTHFFGHFLKKKKKILNGVS